MLAILKRLKGWRCSTTSYRRHSTVPSSLFAADSEAAAHVVAVVRPDLDFDHLFSNLDRHQLVLGQRGVAIDLRKLMHQWQTWEQLGYHLHEMKADPSIPVEEKNSFKKKMDAEARFMYDALELPNWLLPETAKEHDRVVYQFQTRPNGRKSHLELGSKLQEIVPSVTGSSFYLMGQAARFELLAQRRLSELFLATRFEPLSSPDLLKPVVLEGSGTSLGCPSTMKLTPEAKDPFGVKTLRLAGSASFAALSAYFTRVKFRGSDLPRSYSTLGRLYRRSDGPLHCGGLYNSNQSTALAFLTLTAEDPNLDFELSVERLKNIFTELEVHFQIVETGSRKLGREESRRHRFEMWSTTFNHYVPVAFVSVTNDYVSRRLICCYDDADAVSSGQYVNMTHGNINVTHLLAALMECTQDEDGLWKIPTFFE